LEKPPYTHHGQVQYYPVKRYSKDRQETMKIGKIALSLLAQEEFDLVVADGKRDMALCSDRIGTSGHLREASAALECLEGAITLLQHHCLHTMRK
jgi:hypothetical protein